MTFTRRADATPLSACHLPRRSFSGRRGAPRRDAGRSPDDRPTASCSSTAVASQRPTAPSARSRSTRMPWRPSSGQSRRPVTRTQSPSASGRPPGSSPTKHPRPPPIGWDRFPSPITRGSGSGLYEITATTDVCQVHGWVNVTGQSPLETPAGLVSVGIVVLGVLIAAPRDPDRRARKRVARHRGWRRDRHRPPAVRPAGRRDRHHADVGDPLDGRPGSDQRSAQPSRRRPDADGYRARHRRSAGPAPGGVPTVGAACPGGHRWSQSLPRRRSEAVARPSGPVPRPSAASPTRHERPTPDCPARTPSSPSRPSTSSSGSPTDRTRGSSVRRSADRHRASAPTR